MNLQANDQPRQVILHSETLFFHVETQKLFIVIYS